MPIIAAGPMTFVLHLIFPSLLKVSEEQIVNGFLVWILYVAADQIFWATERKLRKGEREMMVFLHGEDKADAALEDYLSNKRFLPPEQHLDHPERIARAECNKKKPNERNWSEAKEDKLS